MGRFVALALVLSSLLVAPVVGAAPCWLPPVAAPVADPFRAPPCPWCAGNRGIEYHTAPETVVRSVAAGRVTFSGSVAGTRYVVVEIAGGWLLTYGRLASITVRRGSPVAARTVIGTTSDQLFFGLRINGAYSDPARYLGRWVGRPRLVPIDGSATRYVPPRLRCGGR